MLKERDSFLAAVIERNLSYIEGGLVALDIDNVTQSTCTKAFNKASYKLNVQIFKEQITNYWKLKEIAEANGIPTDKSLSFAKNAYNDDQVYRESSEMPGMRSLLKIFGNKIPYIFYSARPIEYIDVTQDWFGKKFPFVDFEKINIGRKKGTSGGLYKSSIVKEKNIKLCLDDSIEETLEIAANTRAKSIIVPQPWNMLDQVNHPQIKYVTDFIESENDISTIWPIIRFLKDNSAADFLKS